MKDLIRSCLTPFPAENNLGSVGLLKSARSENIAKFESPVSEDWRRFDKIDRRDGAAGKPLKIARHPGRRRIFHMPLATVDSFSARVSARATIVPDKRPRACTCFT